MTKQLKHVWSVLAQSSSTDAVNNSFSLFNIIDELTVDFKPTETKIAKDAKKKDIITLPAQFQIATLWKRITDSNLELVSNVKVSFLDPEGIELQQIEYPMTIPVDKKRMRFVTQVIGINLSVSGEYKFLIKLKEPDSVDFKEVAEVPIDVIIKKYN
jgi:hypothetical protein